MTLHKRKCYVFEFPGNLPVMEDNLPVMSLWRFTGNLPVGKLPVNITIIYSGERMRWDKAFFRCKMAFFKRAWQIVKVLSRP